MPKFREVIFNIISESCDKQDSLTAAQVKELLKLCLLAARHTRRMTPGDVDRQQSIWNVLEVSNLLEKLRTSRFKNTTSLHTLCQQIFGIIGAAEAKKAGENVNKGESKKTHSQKKRKAEQEEESKDEVKKPKKKKVKKLINGEKEEQEHS